MSSSLDRSAACPNCGAPMVFRFASAAAQVCAHCRFVVARTDRVLRAVGRMGDLLELPSPFRVGATGRLRGEPLAVEGRVQMDRAGAPGAPWQEILVSFPNSGRWAWIAQAQGRHFETTPVPTPPGLPRWSGLSPGQAVQIPGHGAFTLVEVGQRRVVSGEGELPRVPPPGVVTRFADLEGPGGAFGTIDYGVQGSRPELFLGRAFDPAEIAWDAGESPARPEARVTSVRCPQCGGDLPLVASSAAERVICRYCGMTSDLANGALRALRPAPPMPVAPFVPLGAEGQLGAAHVVCVAFLVRGCTVEGVRYRWREYLLWAGPSKGYLWLLEEDGRWSLATPISGGDVQLTGSTAVLRGASFSWKQTVQASVEHVVGELYWRVEIGETVEASDFEGPGGTLSVERAPTELSTSFVTPLTRQQVAGAFRLPLPPSGPTEAGAVGKVGQTLLLVGVLLLLFLLMSADDCDDGACYGPSLGPSFGGK